MKKGQTHRHRKAGVRWAMHSLMERHQLRDSLQQPECQHTCGYYAQHGERLSSVCGRLQDEAVFFAHTIRLFIQGLIHAHTVHICQRPKKRNLCHPSERHPKEGFAAPMSLRHWSLTCLGPCQQYTFTQGFICSSQSSILEQSKQELKDPCPQTRAEIELRDPALSLTLQHSSGPSLENVPSHIQSGSPNFC